MADFVSHQQRIVSTKGEESELAENWDRFSNIPNLEPEQQNKPSRRLQARAGESVLTPEQTRLED